MSLDAEPVLKHTARIAFQSPLNPLETRFPNCELVLPMSVNRILKCVDSALLHLGQQDSAYFIECHECIEERDANSAWWQEWHKELLKAEKKLSKMNLLAEGE